MTTDEEKLITDNINIAHKLSWSYYKKFNGLYEFDDIQSLCMIGLVRAGTTFKSELGFKFSTYAYSCINNEVKRFYKDNKKYINNISLSNIIADDLEAEQTLADDYDMLEEIQKNEDIETLHKEIDKLKPRYKDILHYRLKGMTFNEIGKVMGLSQPQISRDFNKALNILRYKFRVERGGINYER